MTASVGDLAPNFTLPIVGGKTITLSDFALTDFARKKVIIYFYPKDATSGCTKEACDFRDNKLNFEKKNTIIIGISKDSVNSHEKFKEKEGLNFILATDETGEVCVKYGVWVEKSMYGRKYFGIQRSTFLIDEAGRITKIWRKVSVPGHVEEVLGVV
ncbi:MAG TPA: thioredoxin-dependent thiol peroxidase [Alphaproteobacteria bacterium]|nr:thioredoxin-dependent thiol peroxidase [Alphaproteobacteria bacterium]